MTNAALISLGSTSSQWTVEAMRKYFSKVDMINLKDIDVTLGRKPEILVKGEHLKKYDCIYAKGSFRYANLLKSISMVLDDSTYLPINPSAFTIVHNKLLTHLELQKHNIPMPKTYISPSTEAAKRVLKKINYPIVMKFPEGTHGKGVMFADSFASASSLLDALGVLNQPFIIQEYIDTGGIDIRAIVIGDKVVAAMERKAGSEEMRSNIHAGGEARAITLDRIYQKVAIDTAHVLGAQICGVDMLRGPLGPLVIEANLSPGLQGVTQACGIDVADYIAKHLFKQAKSSREKKTNISTSDLLKEENGKKELITNLKFKGDNIVLPTFVTKSTKFNERDNYTIKAEKGKLFVEKFDI